MDIMATPRVMGREIMGRAGMERGPGAMEVSKELRLGVATLGVIMGMGMVCFRPSGRIEPVWFLGLRLSICIMYLLGVICMACVLWFVIGDRQGIKAIFYHIFCGGCLFFGMTCSTRMTLRLVG